MTRIARVIYGRIKDIYDTEMTFAEWRLAHSPATLFIDVTNKVAEIGDDVDLESDGSYKIVPQTEWFKLAEKRLNRQNTVAEEKELKLKELNDLVATALLDSFLYKVTVSETTFLCMEKQALDYINNKKKGKLLQELANAEKVDIQVMAEKIMERHNKIASTTDKLVDYYGKWLNVINKAKTIDEIQSIVFSEV